MCILPETFITDYISKLEEVSEDEIKKAKEVLEKAAKKLLETAEPDKINTSNVKDTSPFY